MVFERIIAVNGHQYKYLVMNVRDGNKVKQKTIKYLGRADKEHDSPYGLYYFSQEGCGACETKEQVEHTLMCIQRVLKDETLPKLHYVNLSRDKNPLNIKIHVTPTAIEITRTKIFIGHHFASLFNPAWLNWRYGEKRAKEIAEASQAAWKKEHEEIIQHVKDGKDGRWLKKKGYNELDILSARDTVRREKLSERREKRYQEKRKQYEEWERAQELKKCQDGVCKA